MINLLNMETVWEIIGHGKDLSVSQMAVRGIIVFIVCLLLIRICGRRAFGMRMPMDNVITILLGAILSRAVVGNSPFIATIVTAILITILYRIFAWLSFYNRFFERLVKGEKKVIYSNGKLKPDSLRYCLTTYEDIMKGVRISSNLNSLDEVDIVYMEGDGQISVVKKKEAS